MTSWSPLKEPIPPYGKAEDAAPGIRRVVAPNPGPMTYHGTNTYLVSHDGDVFVVDPGPAIDSHIRAVVDAAGGRPAAIILTHHHIDHSEGIPALRQATGAPVFAHPGCAAFGIAVDHPLDEGDSLAGMRVLSTPGHASTHLCLARPGGLCLSGDHIMGWNSTVVSLPDGNMASYLASLRRLQAEGFTSLLPGHGPAVPEPDQVIRYLFKRRARREKAITGILATGAVSVADIADQFGTRTNDRSRQALERTIIAHLEKLHDEGRARADGDLWRMVP